MFAINGNETLYKVTIYELNRADGTLTIKVQEALTESPCKFTAVPSLHFSEAPEQYFGSGITEDAALNDCLLKIKDKTIPTDLFPHAVS